MVEEQENVGQTHFRLLKEEEKCWFLDVTASLALELRYFSGQDACFA